MRTTNPIFRFVTLYKFHRENSKFFQCGCSPGVWYVVRVEGKCTWCGGTPSKTQAYGFLGNLYRALKAM